ncbi:MAG: sigma-70 family RNA polymerase sigma factor [Armatimonadota bacterium]
MERVRFAGSIPEAELVGRVVAGDPEAGEAFVSRYGRLIAHCVTRAGIVADDIEDVCQKVYVHLWDEDCRRLRAWRGEAPLSSFLGRVVGRLSLDHIRATPVRTVSSTDSRNDEDGEVCGNGGGMTGGITGGITGGGTSPVEAAAEARWQQSALSGALDTLSNRDVRLLLLRHWDGLSYREIAAHHGWTVNHVGVALSNAERRCRSAILARSPELFGNRTDACPKNRDGV